MQFPSKYHNFMCDSPVFLTNLNVCFFDSWAKLLNQIGILTLKGFLCFYLTYLFGLSIRKWLQSTSFSLTWKFFCSFLLSSIITIEIFIFLYYLKKKIQKWRSYRTVFFGCKINEYSIWWIQMHICWQSTGRRIIMNWTCRWIFTQDGVRQWAEDTQINARMFYVVKAECEMNVHLAEWSALCQYYDSFMSDDSKSFVHCIETL